MDPNILWGTIIIIVALAAIAVLVLVSDKTINRVAEKRLRSVRDIVRELKNGR